MKTIGPAVLLGAIVLSLAACDGVLTASGGAQREDFGKGGINCGNGACSGKESCSNCPRDCGACAAPSPASDAAAVGGGADGGAPQDSEAADGSLGASGDASGSTTTRDPLRWPFAQKSIWNMPIGSGAKYVSAGLTGNPGGDVWAPMPQIDEEHIVLKAKAPLTSVYYSSAGWTGANRCSPTGALLVKVPIPSSYVVANNNKNGVATFLTADGKSFIQMQPFTRCAAGGSATSLYYHKAIDIRGDGIIGAHGGSRLSGIGGTLRVGELRPGGKPPRHALKVAVYAKLELYRCTTRSDCYRWPAQTADGYAVGRYGTGSTAAPKAMKMGALLAIPASVNLGSLGLKTGPAKMLAWTLQHFGAYVVDDTWGPGFAIDAEVGPDGSFAKQFASDWGFALAQRVHDASSWVKDIQKLVEALDVVDNNSATNIGGGGTPLTALAPPFRAQ